jgi:hypothetical protein
MNQAEVLKWIVYLLGGLSIIAMVASLVSVWVLRKKTLEKREHRTGEHGIHSHIH